MIVEYLMSKRLQRLTDSLSWCLVTIFNAVVGWTTVALLHAIRFIPRTLDRIFAVSPRTRVT